MDALTGYRRLLLVLGFGLVVACGGPGEEESGDEFATSEEGLVATPSRPAAGAPQAPAQIPTTRIAYAAPTSGAASVAYLVNGDSSPDPIPARSGDDTRKYSVGDCDEAFPPGFWRDLCHEQRGGE